MKNNFYYREFIRSLSDSQKEDYRQMSINQQKDWYISYLEDHYNVNKNEKKNINDKATEFIEACNVFPAVHAKEGGIIELHSLLTDFVEYIEKKKS